MSVFRNLLMPKHGYITEGLFHHFDAIDNVGTGIHDPNTTIWKDLVGSRDGTVLGGAPWRNGDSLEMLGNAANTKVSFSGNIQPIINNGGDYTLTTVMYMVNTPVSGNAHPRICGDPQYPSIYFSTATAPGALLHRIYFYGNPPDTNFQPHTYPNYLTRFDITINYSATTKIVELYINGEYKANLPNVNPRTGTTTAYIGGNSTNTRCLTGHFCNYMVYNRKLSPHEIMQNFKTNKSRFHIPN